MATIEVVTTTTPAATKKEATDERTLTAGASVKLEIGNDDLKATVPAGKEWDVVANIRIAERIV